MRSTFRSVKNTVYSYNDAERRVREATSNDEWPPSADLLQQIARDTANQEFYPSTFKMLWKRLHDYQHITHVEKSLIVLEHLIKGGSDTFVEDITKPKRLEEVNKLKKYKYFVNGRE